MARLLALIALAHVSEASASPLFESDDVLEISLTGPLSTLFDEKDDPVERPFLLRANGVEHAVKVRARGKSRRRVCSFPPLRLNFSSKDAEGSVFQGQDKIKLVTHCRGRDSAQSDAIQEFAAYRIFNLISDYSYRVRLLRITYTDTDGGLKDGPIERYGFVIEPPALMAERIGGQSARVDGVSLKSLDSRHAASVFVFHYLIGNTDWSLVMADEDDTCCHNGDIYDVGSARYYVPYDFDLSGLVNPRYAKPDPSLAITRVTQRLYRGYCIDPDALRDALGAIKARRSDILGIVEELPGLSQKERDGTTRYLQRFFDQASDEDKMVQMFERRCL